MTKGYLSRNVASKRGGGGTEEGTGVISVERPPTPAQAQPAFWQEIGSWVADGRIRCHWVKSGLATFAVAATLSLALALIGIYAVGSLANDVLQSLTGSTGGVPISSSPTGGGVDVSVALRALAAALSFAYFTAHAAPYLLIGPNGATWNLFGVGSFTILAGSLALSYRSGRRLERLLPYRGSDGRAALRATGVAISYWLGTLLLYFLGSVHLASGLISASLRPSLLGLLTPLLIVGGGAALGALSMRPTRINAYGGNSIRRGVTRGLLALLTGIGLLVCFAIVRLLLAAISHQSVAPAPTGVPSSGLDTSNLWLAGLLLLPFYLGNGLLWLWGAALGGLTFNSGDLATGLTALIPVALGVIAGAGNLRRPGDRIEQVSFAASFGIISALATIVVSPSTASGLLGGSPLLVLLVGTLMAAVGAWGVPYLLYLRPASGVTRVLALGAVGRFVFSFAPEVAPAFGDLPSEVAGGVPATAWPRPGRRGYVALGAMTGMIAAAVIGNAVLNGIYAPEKTVLAYLAAQSKADAGGMWRVATFEPNTGRFNQLLSRAGLAAMMAQEVNKQISDVRVVNVQRVDSETAAVAVAVSQSGTAGTMKFTVRKDPRASNLLIYPSWKVAIPAATVDISRFNYAGALSVDGVEITSSDTSLQLEVIPGHHMIRLAPTALFEGSSQGVDATSGHASAEFQPTLNSGATNGAAVALKAAFEQCAATHDLTPAGCPQEEFAIGSTISNVQWTLVGDPTAGMQFRIGDGPNTLAVSGDFKMSVSYDWQLSDGYGGHQNSTDAGPFSATLRWNGSGFEVVSFSRF